MRVITLHGANKIANRDAPQDAGDICANIAATGRVFAKAAAHRSAEHALHWLRLVGIQLLLRKGQGELTDIVLLMLVVYKRR